MIEVRDSFLHFLADNLSGVPVHYLVNDPDDSSSSHYKLNSLNVEFLTENPKVGIGTFSVSLDLIYESEIAMLPVMSQVFQLLTAAGMTTLYDYSGSVPQPLDCMLYWEVTKIHFRKLYTDNYSRRSCVLTLYTHVS